MNTPSIPTSKDNRCWPRCETLTVVREMDFGYAVFRVLRCEKCGYEKHDWTPRHRAEVLP